MPICATGSWFESNFEDRRRVGVLGQPAAHAVDARAHFVGGLRQVMTPFEVQLDLAVALGRAATGRATMPGTALTACSIGPRDQLLHLERTDAGVAGADVERRLLELRHQVDGQPGQRNEPEQRDDRADHEHRDRPLNRETRNAHINTLSMTYVKCGTSTDVPDDVPLPTG